MPFHMDRIIIRQKRHLLESDNKILIWYQQVMICQCSGNGVSQEGLQQKRGGERSLRCPENRAALHSFLGSCGYSRAPRYQWSSNFCIFSRGMGAKLFIPGGNTVPWCFNQLARVTTDAPKRRFMATVTVLRFSGAWRNEPLTHWLKAPMAGPHHIW